MDDRKKQLERSIEQEIATTGSKFALIGFGRSTPILESKDSALKEGQQMMRIMDSIIRVEEEMRRVSESGGVVDDAMGDVLGSLNRRLQDKKGKQQTRVREMGREIGERSGELKARIRSMLARQGQDAATPKRIKELKGAPIIAIMKVKDYSPLKARRIKELRPKKIKSPLE